jgi:hypothetical protein
LVLLFVERYHPGKLRGIRVLARAGDHRGGGQPEPWKKGTALVLHGLDPVTITLIKRSEKMR